MSSGSPRRVRPGLGSLACGAGVTVAGVVGGWGVRREEDLAIAWVPIKNTRPKWLTESLKGQQILNDRAQLARLQSCSMMDCEESLPVVAFSEVTCDMILGCS